MTSNNKALGMLCDLGKGNFLRYATEIERLSFLVSALETGVAMYLRPRGPSRR